MASCPEIDAHENAYLVRAAARVPTCHSQFVAGTNATLIRVVLPRDFNKSRQRELGGAMSKETQRSPYVLDRDIRAADALELARLMHPGPERNVRLKVANLLWCAADRTGLIFAKRGSPRK
jgi:hypothetical protein